MAEIAGAKIVQYDDNVHYPSASIANYSHRADGETGVTFLHEVAMTSGDITHLLSESQLTGLGQKVAQDWARDKGTISIWREEIERALDDAAQEKPTEVKDWPFENASNVAIPVLTTASQQFQARAFPALIKDDEVASVKLLGKEPSAPPPLPPEAQQDPQAQQLFQAAMQEHQANVQAWQADKARSERVKAWLNYVLFYQMPGWADDMDRMLAQIPTIGIGFKKVYPERGMVKSEYVNALNLTVALDTKVFDACPRVTQDFTLYPYEIRSKQLRGDYRDVALGVNGEDDQKEREIIEQHRLEDLDDDGLAEPYIVTVDVETNQILRLEAAFGPDDVIMQDGANGPEAIEIKRWFPYVKYPFLRDPKGRFYEMGFGKLLESIMASVDTSVNQLIDAGTAQIAGGGFIFGGLRLQGNGQNSSLRWRLGEYKVVLGGATGRDSVWEKTFPNPSPVTFQLLDMLLASAKDITAVKDVLTGDAPSTAPVGTTLALINQSLAQFVAIYKRIYESLRQELRLIYDCMGRWGAPDPKLYAEITGDSHADFKADFSLSARTVEPVADPNVVSHMQAVARAQALMQAGEQLAMQLGVPINGPEIGRRVFEALGEDNVEALILPPAPPNPMEVAKVGEIQARTGQLQASASQARASALEKTANAASTMHGAINDTLTGAVQDHVALNPVSDEAA